MNPNLYSRYVAVQPLKGFNDEPTTPTQRVGIVDSVCSAQDILNLSFNREYLS